MENKRAQIAFEFLILGGFLMFALVSFFIVLQKDFSVKMDERENTRLREIAISIKNEISLASESIDGYRREFSLPSQIYGRDYYANISENFLTVWSEGDVNIVSFGVRNVTGQINITKNIIRRENGVVKLNV